MDPFHPESGRSPLAGGKHARPCRLLDDEPEVSKNQVTISSEILRHLARHLVGFAHNINPIGSMVGVQ